MTPKKKHFFFLLVLFSFFLHGQEKIMLSEFLKDIEHQFDCGFSYADQNLEHHVIVPKQLNSLESTLLYLSQKTLFEYKLLNDKIITVQKRDNVFEGCGKVKSLGSNEPLIGATITTPYQIFPSGEGAFEVRLKNGLEKVSITYPGKTAKEVLGRYFESSTCKEVFLSEEIQLLNTVTLKNYLAKGITKNNDGSLAVDYTNFDILPGLIEPDVLLTIQALPGIQSVNETISYLNIRGGTNDQNLILWDGIKMYQNSHFFGLISAFNSNLIKEVSIVKNGTSASFGDGVSGTIAMKSDSEVTASFTSEVGINLLSADAFVDVPLGRKASLQVSGRKSINSIYSSPTFSAYFERAFQNTEVTNNGTAVTSTNSNFSFFDTSIRGILKPTEKDRIRFNFMYLGNSLNFLENATIGSVLQSLQSDLTQHSISGGLFYQRQWNENTFSQLQLYGTSYQLGATNFDILNAQRLIQENSILENGFKLQTQHLFSDQLQGTVGYQLNETGITNFEQINNPFFEREDKQVLITQSSWAEATYQPLESTFLKLGLRANHIPKFNEFLWEPRLQFTHQFLKYFTFEVLGEFKSQTTSQVIDFQEDFLGVENRRWVLSHPNDIPIIKSQQVSTGVSLNRKGWLATVEPYVKQVDGITTSSQGFQNQFQNNREIGKYTVYGIDLLLNKRFRHINTWLSYSYARNNYFFENLSPQEFPNNLDVRHTLTYGIAYNLDQFNIAGGFNWHTGKPNTLLNTPPVDETSSLNFTTPNSTNIDDYMRVDVSATYRFPIGKKAQGFAGASIWNLFNKKNNVNHFFRLNAEDQVEEIDEVALRFTPNFSFRIQF